MQIPKLSLFLIVALLSLFVIPAPSVAQRGKKITVQETWPYSDFGFFRVKVRLAENPLNPAVESQRYFLVATNSSYPSDRVIASTPFTLEAGDAFVDAEVYLPIQQDWNSHLELHIETDGNMKKGRNDLFSKTITLPATYQDGSRTLLIVSSNLTQSESESTIVSRGKTYPQGKKAVSINNAKFPSIDVISDMFSINQQLGQVTGNATKSSTLDSPSVHAIKPEDLPRKWLGLTAVQMILISNKDLQDVIKNHRMATEALTQWVAAGGSLIVTECGAKFELAEKVRSQIPANASSTRSRQPQWMFTKNLLWKRSDLLLSRTPVYMSSSSGILSDADVDPSIRHRRLDSRKFGKLPFAVDLNQLPEEFSKEPSLVSANGFAFYSLVQGRVFVVKDTTFNWKKKDWVRLMNATALSGRGIDERLAGLSLNNRDDFMVPGVGQPPVRAFEFLICLFILVVGPISYFVLKRQKRLQLLFVVVPAISLLACISLFAYAVFSEGLQVRGRIKSVTQIDHVTNMAISHIRHSHYAGVQPSPYEFADSDFVINGSYSNRVSMYRNEQDRSTLSGGNIRPRMPHQVMAVQNYQTDAKLALLAPDGENPRVQNKFSSEIKLAVFRTDKGICFVSDLQPDGISTGEPIDLSQAASKLKKLSQALSPQVFDEFEMGNNGYGAFRTVRYNIQYGNDYDAVPDCDYLLDELGRLSGAELLNQQNSYIAILDDLDLIRQPIPNIDYKHQVHVVRGKW